ncbi:unnamed protein product [Dibothriocephalus latus]|uniref:Uncharacterized protein n=1 Tax=Dibothriocephalus latus TaxID=60516 RepID=A0A3P7NID5_DIBLA|nr:unnamed protein product [Dibothriocephalus latus]
MEVEEEVRVMSSPTTRAQKPPSPAPVTEPQLVPSMSPERVKKEVEVLKTYQAELSPPSGSSLIKESRVGPDSIPRSLLTQELLSKFQEGELMATEEVPPTVADGTPRVVPTEDVPMLVPSKIETTLSAAKPRDDLGLLPPRADDSRPVENDFIVASEGLKRKEMGPVGHADSYARQIAAEELADTLGLDADVELVSVLKQSEEPSAEAVVIEDEIKAVKLEPKAQVSPILLRPTVSEQPSPECIRILDGLHVDTGKHVSPPSLPWISTII